MSGTRLVIQLTFLLEFIILIVLSAYFGLCHRNNGDVLCRPIFLQGGRTLLIVPPEWSTDEQQDKHDVDSNTSLKRYHLHVTLVLEDGSEWKQWAAALDESLLGMRNSNGEQTTTAVNTSITVAMIANYPCLVGPVVTEISLADGASLSTSARSVANSRNETEYRVSRTAVQTWLANSKQGRHPFDASRLDVVLYVPTRQKSPLLVKLKRQEAATAIVDGHQLLSIVVQQHQDDNDNDNSSASAAAMVKTAMAYVDPFVKDMCRLDDSMIHSTESWWQQLVHDLHQLAKENVLMTHYILTTLSLRVAITTEVAQEWRRSMDLVDEGVQFAERGGADNLLAAVECLEESLALSQELLRNPTLAEPIDMQYDHYMAVFFPLLFPLLVPFVAGTIREAKRYKKLRKDHGTSQTSCIEAH